MSTAEPKIAPAVWLRDCQDPQRQACSAAWPRQLVLAIRHISQKSKQGDAICVWLRLRQGNFEDNARQRIITQCTRTQSPFWLTESSTASMQQYLRTEPQAAERRLRISVITKDGRYSIETRNNAQVHVWSLFKSVGRKTNQRRHD